MHRAYSSLSEGEESDLTCYIGREALESRHLVVIYGRMQGDNTSWRHVA